MKNKLRFLMKNKQGFLALFVLLVMVFNACSNPVGGLPPQENKPNKISPIYYYLDESGNLTETDSGRTVLVADEKAYVTFYSDDITVSDYRVGFSFDNKTILFIFEENRNFPTKMVLSDPNGTYNGYLTPYHSDTQTYFLVIEQGSDQEIMMNISMSNDVFTQYKDNPSLNASQNLRLRNLYIAMCVYKSLDNYISANYPNSRFIWNFVSSVIKIFIPSPVVDIVVGGIAIAYGATAGSILSPLSVVSGANLIVNGINQLTPAVPSGSSVSVNSVSLNKTSLSLSVNGSETLTANITPSNAANKSVSWSSSNTSVATVSSNGTVIGRASGSSTITVKTADGNRTASCSVTVNSSSTGSSVTGVSLNKTYLSLSVGNSETLTATITPTTATNKTVSWSSSNTSVATVSSNGTVYGQSSGSATITVKTADGNKTASCSVTVNSSSTGSSVTGVSLNKSSLNLAIGNSETLTATILPSSASNKSVSWSSNNTSVATVSSNGSVTAVTFGSAVITVTTSSGGYTASCTVTVVQNVPVNKIEYYWVNENGNLATTSGGNTVTIAAGATLTITSQAAGYVVKQWHLNGVNTGQSGNTYIFSSTAVGKHTVGLFVEKDGKLYNTNITIMVQ